MDLSAQGTYDPEISVLVNSKTVMGSQYEQLSQSQSSRRIQDIHQNPNRVPQATH